MASLRRSRVMAAAIPPVRKKGGPPLASWRQDVAPTVIAMAAEMAPEELTARAVAQRMGLQDPQIWRALPRGRADILFLVACDLQIRQAKAVAEPNGPRKRTARARVEALVARMLAFDFEPQVRAWRRACAAQGWYWTRQQYIGLGELDGPLDAIEKDAGAGISVVWAIYERTFRDACVMEWTLEETTKELVARLQVVNLGGPQVPRPLPF